MSASFQLAVHTDAWLSEVMKRDVCSVALKPSEVSATLPLILNSFSERVAHGLAFAFTKVDCANAMAVNLLEEIGFRVVDVNVTMRCMNALQVGSKSTSSSDLSIDFANEADRDETLAIAESCFRFSRFHLDSKIDLSLANRIKRLWIENYFLKQRGDSLLIAKSKGKVAGFLAAVVTKRESVPIEAVIDLIGVAEEARGQGIASALTQRFFEHYSSIGNYLVGSQVANSPALRLYQRLGFQFDSAKYVLHWHR